MTDKKEKQSPKDIAGYKLVLALHEAEINKALASTGVQTHDLPTHWTLQGDKGAWRFDVEFKPPQIDFNTNILNGCRLKLEVTSGAYSSFAFEGLDENSAPIMKKTKLDLKGMVFFITTPMNKRQQDGGDELFTPQAIYAELTQVKDVTFSDEHAQKVDMAGSQQVELQTLIKQKLAEIGEEKPDALLFGKVNVPKTESSGQAFKVIGTDFSVTRIMDGSTYSGGVLNFLLLTDGDEHQTAVAAGVLPTTLLQQDSKHEYWPGALVISDYLLLEKVFMPQVLEWLQKQKRKGATAPNLTTEHRDANTPAKMHLVNTFQAEKDGDNQTYFTKVEGISTYDVTISYEGNARRQHWSGDLYADFSGNFTYTPKFDFTKDPPSFICDGNVSKIKVTGKDTKGFGGWLGRTLGDLITLNFDEIGISDRIDELEERGNTIYQLQDTLGAVISLMELPGKAVLQSNYMIHDEHLYFRVYYK